jgi:hypothetical protein
MNTTQSYYLQTRSGEKSWETVGNGTRNESLALRRLVAAAEGTKSHVIWRVMTGNPFSGEVTSVIATRNGVK